MKILALLVASGLSACALPAPQEDTNAEREERLAREREARLADAEARRERREKERAAERELLAKRRERRERTWSWIETGSRADGAEPSDYLDRVAAICSSAEFTEDADLDAAWCSIPLPWFIAGHDWARVYGIAGVTDSFRIQYAARLSEPVIGAGAMSLGVALEVESLQYDMDADLREGTVEWVQVFEVVAPFDLFLAEDERTVLIHEDGRAKSRIAVDRAAVDALRLCMEAKFDGPYGR